MGRDNADARAYLQAVLQGYGLSTEQLDAVITAVEGITREDRAVATDAISAYNALITKHEDVWATLHLALEQGTIATAMCLNLAEEYKAAVQSFSDTLSEIAGND